MNGRLDRDTDYKVRSKIFPLMARTRYSAIYDESISLYYVTLNDKQSNRSRQVTRILSSHSGTKVSTNSVAFIQKDLIPINLHAPNDEPDSSKPSLLGSFNAVDVNDSKVQELSSYALAHMDSLSDDQHLRRVEQVLEAHRKVVAGLLWVIKSKVVYTNCPKETQNSTDLTNCETDTSKPTYICHLEIYERPWEKFRTVQESRCESETSTTRQRRSSDAQTKHTLGSPNAVDIKDPKIQELSTFALNHLDQVSEDSNLRKVDEILEASKQIVAGVLWSLKIRVVSTVCTKDSASSADVTACEVDTSKPSSICVVKIWEKVWENSTTVTEAHCEPESTPSNRNRRFAAGNIESRPGSAKTVDVNDPRVQKLSSFALNHMDQVSEDGNLRKVDEILEATKQIVRGNLWSLKIRVVSTVCPKDSGNSADATACEVDTSKPSSICVVKIWEQVWENSTTVTEAHCEPESTPSNRNRRFAAGNIESSPPGSAKTVNVNDPRVQKLSIIVRGNLWSLKLRVVSTVCTKDSGSSADGTACEVDTSKPSSICVVKIWEQVWENSTTVTEAHCEPESTPSNRNRRFAAGNIESRPGSAKTVDVNDPRVQKLSSFALNHLDQIVRGNLWSLKLRVVSTVCTKDSGSSADGTACEVDTSKPSSICVVKIWEQVWENSTTVTEAHCEPESTPSNRNRRFAAGNTESRPGSAKTVDVNDPRVQKLSSFALNHLDQIVRGNLWSLKLRIVSTVCTKDSGSAADATACEVDTSKPSSICVVKIWEQVWENSTTVTEAHCEPESTPSNRNRRFAAGNIESRPGSAKTVDVNDPRVQKLSSFALNHLDQVSEDSNLRKVDEILEATKQIVAGVLWSLKIRVVSTVCPKDSGSSADATACEVVTSKPSSICVVKIWEKVWENSTTVTEAHCEPESTPSNRNRRFAAGETNSKPGSATPIDVNDPKVQELSTFALNHMDQVSEDSNLRKVDEILEASRQLISGYLWQLKIRVVPTLCAKDSGSSADGSECEIDSSKPSSICIVKISEQLWKNSKKVTEAHCEPQNTSSNRKRRSAAVETKSMPGSVSPVDVNDPDIQELSSFALDHMDELSEDSTLRKVDEVLEAKSQVVSGVLYSLKIRIVSTLCSKGKESLLDSSSCEVDSSKPKFICNVKIWEKPWNNSRDLTESKCSVEDTITV
ncbi:Multicystatin [Armadillidium vulgare]|nr:Multicystatin [Armadillidium vulgare]